LKITGIEAAAKHPFGQDISPATEIHPLGWPHRQLVVTERAS
jgi:hypothetical protein